MIEVKELTKVYTITGETLKAVDNVSFTAEKADMISIVGHSGSGKTTLLSLIGGLTKPDSGRITINGQDLWDMDDNHLSEFRNSKISFIYQFSSLIPTLTAIENVMLPAAFGTASGDFEKYARELISLVGLGDKINSYPAHLSGGQQRRVAIARAFINNPEIILADEPTGDLDEQTEQEILRLFQSMNRERQVTFIIVTHDKEIANQTKRQMKMSRGILSNLT